MQIIITDLTRFANPDIVCLAGIDSETGSCIRPMLGNGRREEYFRFEDVRRNGIIPGSCISGNFLPVQNATHPHIEDHRSDGVIDVVESVNGATFESVLETTAQTSIRKAFGSRPSDKMFVHQEAPLISIATLRLDSPATQFNIIVEDRFGPPKFKAHIRDAEGFELKWISVTDLGFSDHIQNVLHVDPQLRVLNAFLQSQRRLYIRIGLSRLYAPTPEREGYWVQLNGIYSFPNFRRDLRIYD